jgi:hypothetical protein
MNKLAFELGYKLANEMLPTSNTAEATDKLNRSRRVDNILNVLKYVGGLGVGGTGLGAGIGYGLGSLKDSPGVGAAIGGMAGGYGGAGLGALLAYLNSKNMIQPQVIIPQKEL